MTTETLPPEPGSIVDLDHGVAHDVCPPSADVDDSDQDDLSEVNDYDNFDEED